MKHKSGFRALHVLWIGGLLCLIALLVGLSIYHKPPVSPEETTLPSPTESPTEEESEPVTSDRESLPTLIIREAEASPGKDTVEVEIHLANNSGLAALQFTLHYGDELILTDVDFDNRFGSYTTAPTPYENPQLITFVSPLKDIREEGRFVTLTFRVAPGTPANTTVQLYARIVPENTCNGNLEEVELRVVNATVRIPEGSAAAGGDTRH